jgi:hypothetical protein
VLSWIYKLNLGPVDFEIDSKLVIDGFHSNNYDVGEFGKIISHCRKFYNFFSINSSVEFIANEIAHSFAKTITCIISSHILIDIPNCT